MDGGFMILPGELLKKAAVLDILQSNDDSGRFGLTLTEKDAAGLVKARDFALKSLGRVEFRGGIVNKLARAFCDSPYIRQEEYGFVLGELIEIFYYYKNETCDRVGDDELIRVMKDGFDSRCGGSLELLKGRELDRFARDIRFGRRAYDETEEESGGEDAE